MEFKEILKYKEEAKEISLEAKAKIDSIKSKIYHSVIEEFSIPEEFVVKNKNGDIKSINLKEKRVIYLDKWLNIILYDVSKSFWKREHTLVNDDGKEKFKTYISKYF